MKHLEAAIRKALHSRQFSEAERLLDDYVSELQRRLLARRSSDDIRTAENFLREAAQLTKIARAHLAAQLEPLRKSARYTQPPNAPSTWTLDA